MISDWVVIFVLNCSVLSYYSINLSLDLYKLCRILDSFVRQYTVYDSDILYVLILILANLIDYNWKKSFMAKWSYQVKLSPLSLY